MYMYMYHIKELKICGHNGQHSEQNKIKWPCDRPRWFKLKKMSKCQKKIKVVKKMSNVKKSNTDYGGGSQKKKKKFT